MSQSLACMLVHVIFSTKNRQPFIQQGTMPELFAYMAGTARGCASHVYEIGGVEDHVHVLLTLPRTLALCKLVEELKKSSSKWIKTKGHIYADFCWQHGYGGFSVSQSEVEKVRRYIRNQRQHHAKMTFQDEYRCFLNRYNVAFDERYVWD